MKKAGWMLLWLGLMVGCGYTVFCTEEKDERGEAIAHAEQLSTEGYHRDAILTYEELLEKEPGDVSLKEKIAHEYLLAGKGNKTVEMLEPLSAGQSSNADIYTDLICGYLKTDDISTAVRTVKEGKRLYPTDGKIDYLYRELRGSYVDTMTGLTPVTELRDGYLLARNMDGKLIMTDTEGHEYFTKAEFDAVDDYVVTEESGMKTLLVSVHDGISEENGQEAGAGVSNFRYLDKEGYVRISPKGDFSYVGCPRDGRILIRDTAGWGYLDESMKDLGVRFEDATAFAEGIAAVKEKGKWRIVTVENVAKSAEASVKWYENVVTDEWKVCSISGGILVKTTDGYRLVNGKGEVLSDAYDEVKAFTEKDGVAAVSNNGRWGLMDASGKEICGLIFDETCSGGKDVTAFRQGELWGYMNSEGDVFVEPEFRKAGRMNSEGIAYVSDAAEEAADRGLSNVRKIQLLILE